MKNDNFIGEESGILYADSTFFDFFSLRLMDGDERTALVAPKSIILTENLAAKYYGEHWKNNSIVGKLLLINGNTEYKVTGVIEPLPDNSHLQFNALASFSSLPESKGNGSFDNSAYMTYILLEEHANELVIQDKITDYSYTSISYLLKEGSNGIKLKGHILTDSGRIGIVLNRHTG